MEHWKTIADFEAYEVSDLGVISAIGYAIAQDYRRALYYFFGVCITLCVIWR